MSRVPKPPIGFVPVDSEEARGVDDDQYVLYIAVNGDKWSPNNGTMMADIRAFERKDPKGYRHVFIPPPVEWEEVWGIDFQGEPFNSWLTKNKERFIWIGKLPEDKQQAIVRALNEMEGRDG